MNKNNYKRFLQTKEFADQLIEILRESNPPEYQAAAIIHKLLDTIPGKQVPKTRNGWIPYRIAIGDTIDL